MPDGVIEPRPESRPPSLARAVAATIIASLLLGALTTVVFAIALVAVEANPNTTTWTPRALVWPIPVPADWPQAPQYAGEVRSGMGSARREFAGASLVEHFRLVIHQAGWPFRAFECVSFSGSTIGSATPIPGVTRGRLIQLPDALATDCYSRVFPSSVIWSGFMLDTAMFGAAWAVAVATRFQLRAISRIRRGCCAGCGYEMHGATRCPECGRSTTPAR